MVSNRRPGIVAGNRNVTGVRIRCSPQKRNPEEAFLGQKAKMDGHIREHDGRVHVAQVISLTKT